MSTLEPDVPSALAAAVQTARAAIGDPCAPVVFVMTSRANAALARRALGASASFIRVRFTTADEVVATLGRAATRGDGLRPEPAGWVGASLLAALPELSERGALGERGEALVQPGWLAPLSRAVATLEDAHVTSGALTALARERPEFAPKCTPLAAILTDLAARRGDEGLRSRAGLEAAAAGLQGGVDHPLDQPGAAVFIGDMFLSRAAERALEAWASRRAHVTRIAIAPLESLDAAPGGLRALSERVARATIVVDSGASSLGVLKRRLFMPPAGGTRADDDGAVTLARAPHQVRAVREAVRRVMAAVSDGVALDQCAIVLPDPEGAEALGEALGEAGLPVTWMTGPPLERSASARALSLMLDVALGEQRPRAWHALMNHPCVIGQIDWAGRHRWRSLMGGATRAGGYDQLRSHLRRLERGAHAERPEAEREPLRRAAGALADTLEGIHGALAELPEHGTPGEHAVAMRELMTRYLAPGEGRDRLDRLLEGWGGSDRGAKISLSDAARLLREQLAGTQMLSGSLTQATVRVLSPMMLLGASFELVCVVGMTQGRLPRRVEEDPLLDDALIGALTRRTGARLVDSRAARQTDLRRLASIVSGCARDLWVCWPEHDLIEQRPLVPSSLLLDVLAALDGARSGHSALHARAVEVGPRAVADAAGALGRAEHATARAVAAPTDALDWLTTHAWARRLLALRRGVDRLAHDPDATPDAWTGLVPADVLERLGLDTPPGHDPGQLATLALDPGRFVLERVLGARRPGRLDAAEITPYTLGRRVLDVVTAALDEGVTDPDALRARWAAHVRELEQRRADVDALERDVLTELGERTLASLLEPGLDLRRPVRAEGTRDTGTWVGDEGDALVRLRASEPKKLALDSKRADLALALEALAAREADPEGAPTRIVRRGPTSSRSDALEDVADDARGHAARAAAMVAAGWFPIAGEDGRLGLSAERGGLDTARVDATLAALTTHEGGEP
jgi:hypothetical protein